MLNLRGSVGLSRNGRFRRLIPWRLGGDGGRHRWGRSIRSARLPLLRATIVRRQSAWLAAMDTRIACGGLAFARSTDCSCGRRSRYARDRRCGHADAARIPRCLAFAAAARSVASGIDRTRGKFAGILKLGTAGTRTIAPFGPRADG